MRPNRWLGITLVVLSAGLAVNSLLGPFAAEVIHYHFTSLFLNQTIGTDAFALLVVAPFGLVAAWLARRGHRAGPVLAFVPATYAAYMFPQAIVGPDYLGLPGNNELFFPLHLGLAVLGVAVLFLAWSAIDPVRLPRTTRRRDRLVGVGLLVLAGFLVLGRWLPALIDVMSAHPTNAEYLDNPTMSIWILGLFDLGVAAPATVAAGLGLLLGAGWAQQATYAVVGWFAMVGVAVAVMNITMLVNDEPSASPGRAVAFSAYALAFVVLAGLAYRPLFRSAGVEAEPTVPQPRREIAKQGRGI